MKEYDVDLMNLFDLNDDVALLNAPLIGGLPFMIYAITKHGFFTKIVSDMGIMNLWTEVEPNSD